MTRTGNDLFRELEERGHIDVINALKICPENPRLFECEYVWVDPIGERIKIIGWNERMGNPNIDIFESRCMLISPLRGIQILNQLRKGEI